jgi:hypothetical protein
MTQSGQLRPSFTAIGSCDDDHDWGSFAREISTCAVNTAPRVYGRSYLSGKSRMLCERICGHVFKCARRAKFLHSANSLLHGIPRERCPTIAIYTSSRNEFPTLSWPHPENTTKGYLGVPVSARPRRTIENDTRCQKRGVSGRTDRS